MKLTISLQVPTLSTSWAAAFIFNGLPGTKPTAITSDCAPDKADVRSDVAPVTVCFLIRWLHVFIIVLIWYIVEKEEEIAIEWGSKNKTWNKQ